MNKSNLSTGWLIILLLVTAFTNILAENKNIVPNPGFEEEHETKKGAPKAWTTDGTRFNTNTFWTTEEAHSGKHSLKMAQTNNTQSLTWYSPMMPVKGDTVYTLSFWAKCPETSRYGMMINLCVYDKDKKVPYQGDEPRGNWWLAFVQEGTFDWHKFSRQHRMPKEACYISISLQFWMSAGCVYFDDVSLVAEQK